MKYPDLPAQLTVLLVALNIPSGFSLNSQTWRS